eukprot:1664649-Pyramimonas_sp.AAC.1
MRESMSDTIAACSHPFARHARSWFLLTYNIMVPASVFVYARLIGLRGPATVGAPHPPRDVCTQRPTVPHQGSRHGQTRRHGRT